jgi:hypothetical protein
VNDTSVQLSDTCLNCQYWDASHITVPKDSYEILAPCENDSSLYCGELTGESHVCDQYEQI